MGIMGVERYQPKESWAQQVCHYANDAEAYTTDPEKMATNFRIPLVYLVGGGPDGLENLRSAGVPDPKDELIISYSYASKVLNTKELKGMECYRFKKAGKRPVLKLSPEFKGRCRIVRVKRSYEKLKKILKRKIERNTWRRATRVSVINESVISWQLLPARQPEAGVSSAPVSRASKKLEEGYNPIVVPDRLRQVSLNSVRSLAPNAKLNDEIVDFGTIIAINEGRADASDVLFGPTIGWINYFYQFDQYYPAFVKGYFGSLRDRNKERDFLKYKYMVLPICRERHWVLAVICSPFPDEQLVKKIVQIAAANKMQTKAYSKLLYHKWLTGPRLPKIVFFDSMADMMKIKNVTNADKFHGDTIGYIKRGLLAIHRQIWRERNLSFDVENGYQDMIEHHMAVAPSQPANSEECGLFVMSYAKVWFKELQKVDDDYLVIYRKNFMADFPYYDTINMRHTLYNKIEEECPKEPPELLEALQQCRVYSTIKDERMEEKPGQLTSFKQNGVK